LEVTDATGKPVDAGDHQAIPFAKKVEHRLKFGATCCGCTAYVKKVLANPEPSTHGTYRAWRGV
jgi:hypothetical protein